MSARPRRAAYAAAASLAALLAVGVQTVAGVVLWTMTVSPTTATVGVNTTFTLTATNLDPLLGVKCVIADVPAGIVPGDVWIAASSTTAAWVASRSGQQLIAVIASGDGNQKLTVGDSVSMSFTGVAVQAGTHAIGGVAYSGHECVNGARPLAAPAVIVASQPLVPAPTPPPDPTAAPTPTPASIVVLPSILPTPPPIVARPPVVPAPRATPLPAAPPAAGAVAAAPNPPGRQSAPPPFPVAAPVAATGAPTAADPAQAPAPAASDTAALAVGRRGEPGALDSSVSLGPLGIDGIGVWAIPGAVVGGPGLIVIAWVIVQAGAAMAWVPAVRRLRGDVRRPRASAAR